MKRIFLVLAIGLAVSSCTNSQGSDESSDAVKNTYDIELENNEKWVVIEDMMAHIKNMEADIRASESAAMSYDELGASLDDHIELLTSNCTMTGKAHDELHKWLVPFIGLVEDLNQASSKEQKEESFEAINASMKEFNTYFK